MAALAATHHDEAPRGSAVPSQGSGRPANGPTFRGSDPIRGTRKDGSTRRVRAGGAHKDQARSEARRVGPEADLRDSRCEHGGVDRVRAERLGDIPNGPANWLRPRRRLATVPREIVVGAAEAARLGSPGVRLDLLARRHRLREERDAPLGELPGRRHLRSRRGRGGRRREAPRARHDYGRPHVGGPRRRVPPDDGGGSGRDYGHPPRAPRRRRLVQSPRSPARRRRRRPRLSVLGWKRPPRYRLLVHDRRAAQHSRDRPASTCRRARSPRTHHASCRPCGEDPTPPSHRQSRQALVDARRRPRLGSRLLAVAPLPVVFALSLTNYRPRLDHDDAGPPICFEAPCYIPVERSAVHMSRSTVRHVPIDRSPPLDRSIT
mmetsp:Transcript_20390/g.64080  ORF Transcript_20390/g.64080 Transcript_20390/m.64080 type:complete len:377 (-) Transcript_20390:66-1196(-)